MPEDGSAPILLDQPVERQIDQQPHRIAFGQPFEPGEVVQMGFAVAVEVAGQVVLPTLGNLTPVDHPAKDLEHLQVLLVVSALEETAHAQDHPLLVAGRRWREGRGIHRRRQHFARQAPSLLDPGAGELRDRNQPIVAGRNLGIVTIHSTAQTPGEALRDHPR